MLFYLTRRRPDCCKSPRHTDICKQPLSYSHGPSALAAGDLCPQHKVWKESCSILVPCLPGIQQSPMQTPERRIRAEQSKRGLPGLLPKLCACCGSLGTVSASCATWTGGFPFSPPLSHHSVFSAAGPGEKLPSGG